MVGLGIPFFIGGCGNFFNLGRCEGFVEMDSVKYNPDIFFHVFSVFRQLFSEEADGSVILSDQIQDPFQSGAFSRAVFSDQPTMVPLGTENDIWSSVKSGYCFVRFSTCKIGSIVIPPPHKK